MFSGRFIFKQFFYLLLCTVFVFLLRQVTADYEVYDNEGFVLYTKNKCIYCRRAKALLNSYDIKYKEIDLTSDVDLHIQLMRRTGQVTVPYVYFNDYFIGGYSDLKEMKELENMHQDVKQNIKHNIE